MTPAQMRVVVLLGALLGLEALLSPAVKADLKNPIAFLGEVKHLPVLIAWGVGALGLVALAAIAPGTATSIIVVMLLLVVLSHGTALSTIINGATGAVNALAGHGGTK